MVDLQRAWNINEDDFWHSKLGFNAFEIIYTEFYKQLIRSRLQLYVLVKYIFKINQNVAQGHLHISMILWRSKTSFPMSYDMNNIWGMYQFPLALHLHCGTIDF